MFIKRRHIGVSLFEFLIGFAIFVILLLTAIPSFMTIIKNHRLSGATETLFYYLQLARSEALKQNTLVYFSFVPGNNWCYGIKAGSNCDCTQAGSCSLGAVSASSTQQLSLSAVGYGSNYVTFEGSHGAANNSGSLSFTLYQGSSLITLNIGKLGNIKMCSTGISGYDPC